MEKKVFNITVAVPWPRWSRFPKALARWLLPSPGNVLFTLLVVAGLLWANSVGALPLRAPAAASTSTGTIAYQGRLADADGTPITDTVNMEFRLYDVASGGIFLWEELWTGSNSVQVSDGLFNAMLGSLTPIPQSVITGHDSLFLGITVGTDDEMTPRVQLGTVPFAVQALTVPDGSITTAKLADGAINGDKVLPGTLSLTHTNFLAGAVSIQGPLKTCENHGGEPHCYRDVTVTHNYGNSEYFVVAGTHHGHAAHMFTVSIHGQAANTFIVRATSIVNNYWDEEHEVIVHWLLLPSQ